jgi:tRNA (guanine37-N1)-methyltransferase
MLTFHLLTSFPEFFRTPFEYGVVSRACSTGLVSVETHDLRDYATDRHRTVDDRPFGGDEGMVMKIEPIFLALEQIAGRKPQAKRRVVALSAQGKLFDQATAQRLLEYDEVVLISGRYEGIDERVTEHLADEELSVGSFILSGGEWAAGMVVDAVARLVPGVLGNEASSVQESFRPTENGAHGVLDFPHYTRPAEFRGWSAPEILLSGDHEKIRRWRRKTALAKTRKNRPDLLESAHLSQEDRALLEEIEADEAKGPS